ncbi:MAG: MraY family glycosyltransferase [bacterium]
MTTISPSFVLWALGAFALSCFLTIIVRRFAFRHRIVDCPEQAPERKIHDRPVALLGGLAPYGAFLCTIALILLLQPTALLGGYLLPKHLLGILLAGLLLMIGGFRDDRRSRSPVSQLLWPITAAALIIASGIGIDYLSNPFGAPISLTHWQWTVFTVGDTPYHLVLLADLFTFAWLMLSMYTTKLLDGLDGLVSGISVVGMIILFILSMSRTVGQPETALIALVGAASFLGFLLFNFHPASIFLGEGGALWAGFLLGTLAILSGGKIATALLILGIPMLDVVWVVIRRIVEGRNPLKYADRKHLHFRLLDVGLSHRQAVCALYVCSAVFGSATLFTQGKAKVLALLGVGIVMIILAIALVLRSRRGIDTRSEPPYTGRAPHSL